MNSFKDQINWYRVYKINSIKSFFTQTMKRLCASNSWLPVTYKSLKSMILKFYNDLYFLQSFWLKKCFFYNLFYDFILILWLIIIILSINNYSIFSKYTFERHIKVLPESKNEYEYWYQQFEIKKILLIYMFDVI